MRNVGSMTSRLSLNRFGLWLLLAVCVKIDTLISNMQFKDLSLKGKIKFVFQKTTLEPVCFIFALNLDRTKAVGSRFSYSATRFLHHPRLAVLCKRKFGKQPHNTNTGKERKQQGKERKWKDFRQALNEMIHL